MLKDKINETLLHWQDWNNWQGTGICPWATWAGTACRTLQTHAMRAAFATLATCCGSQIPAFPDISVI